MILKSKEKEINSTYNPALHKFKDIDVFPKKTDAARKHLKGRDIKKEIKEVLEKEKVTKA